jgi:hypothetical protein
VIPVGLIIEGIFCALLFNLEGTVVDTRALEMSYFYGLGAHFFKNEYLFLCDFIRGELDLLI